MLADRDERERALDPARSFIVEAPAGSGKTGLLVQRYLRLLGVVERPESIVAMTFMRKAAGEMKQRIYDALLAARDGSPPENDFDVETRKLALDALAQDRRKSWNLLFDPGRLQIQTIDSVSGMLARQMPVVSEFGGESKIVEDARELYLRAARGTLRDLTEGDEAGRQLFRRMALHFDNDMQRLESQVAAMLEKRDQWEFLACCEQLPLIDDFRELLNKARHALERVFRQTGKIDFTELTRAARKALGTSEHPTDLLYALDYRIEHLLVDEFQDTSRAQYELLDALTGQWSDGDGRTLFLVGDPMQSILRFREAEVGLFLRCWATERLGSVRLTPLRLSTNFRCTAAILEWVEEQFAAIMPDDDLRLGAVKFRHSVASRSSAGATPQLVPFIEDNGRVEASEIVRILKKTPVKHKVGILVRSRAHVVEILPSLRSAGIPYQAIEIDQLSSEQHVLDVISLARAISHTGDRVSWLACLRAPWCGLTLADLAAIAEGEPAQTILDLLSDPERIARLSSEGRARAIRTAETLRDAVEKFGREPLRKLVENTWRSLGGPAALEEPNQHADVETILDLLEDLEEGGVIRDFSLLGPRLEFLYAKPSSEENRVQVMTVHSAKGLEFDTVIIPQLHKETRTSDRELLVWTEETQADGSLVLSIAAQPAKGESDETYKAICAEIDKKELHELGRLFYVACTRARNELFLLASVRTKKNGAECGKPSGTTFLGLIWNSVEEQFQEKLRGRVPVQQLLLPLQNDAPRTILTRLPADWTPPRLDTPVREAPLFRHAAASARKTTFEWVGDTSRHVGTVVHELLKRNRPDLSSGHLTAIVKSELLRLGVPAAEEPEASARVLRAFRKTLESERGRWILQSRVEEHSEWPIAGRIQDRLVSGTIDRVFRDEQNRLWIVDFKIGQHKGGKLDQFLDEEQRRYREQLESYATLLSRIASGPIWLGLYFPLVDGWREWAFAEDAVAAGYSGE
ncbi:MAG TPA: UvrD-helicase domain-containing protein [Bryobacteraceae bacterium]